MASSNVSTNPTFATEPSGSTGTKRNAGESAMEGYATPQSAAGGATRASKRSRTTAATLHAATATLLGHDRFAHHDDHDDDGHGNGDAHDDGHLPPLSKNATEKEKEARRMARMIRNRNAAQASRDRKKEHTAFLERRVAQLEALLRQAGQAAPAALQPVYSAASPAVAAGALPPLPASRLRATSVSSNTSSSEDASRLADLEDENESLRAQLQIEQTEKAQLLIRLELVEEKLARLTTPDAGPISFSPFSGTSTPLPAYEPTFAFNTPDIKPLPQPEELAFVEERERQRRRASQPLVVLGPPFSLDSSVSSSTETQSEDRNAEATGASCPPIASLSTFRLEAHGAGPDAAFLPSTPSLSSSASSASTAGSVSGLELDIPTTPESYLDLHDLDVSPEWSAWAKSVVHPPLDAKAGPPAEQQHHENADADESALAYLNLNPDTDNLCILDLMPPLQALHAVHSSASHSASLGLLSRPSPGFQPARLTTLALALPS
ncbi:hypothetical protein JCM10908_005050 [Rhodotorula pacifica]|uniref:bZIP transcription factor n=1 Tax=Rhodotorula pacifica TaxID=1495444 RepID=UPI00316C9E8D